MDERKMTFYLPDWLCVSTIPTKEYEELVRLRDEAAPQIDALRGIVGKQTDEIARLKDKIKTLKEQIEEKEA